MGFLQRLSLQYRIAGGVLLGLVVLFSFFGWLAVRTINQSKDVALEDRLRLAEITARSVDSLVGHSARQLESLAGLLASDPEERGEMEEIYGVLGTFEKIVRLDAAGRVQWVVPSSSSGGWPLADEPQLLASLEPDRTNVIQLEARGQSHPPVAVVATPVRAADGSLAGFLAGELHLSHAGLELVALPEQEESLHAEIVDGRGYIVAHSEAEEADAPDAHAAILQEFIARHEPGTVVHQMKGVPDHVVAYYPLESLPGGIVVEQTKDKALAIPRNMQRTMLISGLLALVVASGAAWFHAHTVVRPIRQLRHDAGRMAGGELETPITITRQDEIGALAHSFEDMRVKLKASLEESARWARELEDRVRQRTREVEERNRELAELNRARSQLLAKLISAQEEERKRLARELHDDSAQNLTALRMTLQTAEDALPASPSRAQKSLAKSRSQVDLALAEIRKAILDLRPSALDDLGLGAAVRWHAKHHLGPAGVKASLEVTGDEARVGGALATALFRIAQEAISNIVKHARAKNARLSLHLGDSAVELAVEDDGRGFDPRELKQPLDSGRGLGLLGMRERAALFGGTVDIETSPGGGTRVRARIPLE